MFQSRTELDEADLVLFLYIDFRIKRRDLHGFIAVVMDLPSIIALKEVIREFIEGLQRSDA